MHSSSSNPNVSPKEIVLKLVKSLPKGKITSYGRIANKTGLTARVVGFILNSISIKEAAEMSIPWHRVVNKEGFISSSKLGEKGIIQSQMLLAEGVEVKEFQVLNPEQHWFL